MPPNFPNGLVTDQKDFNIVATRIHRVLTLRRMVERTVATPNQEIAGRDELDSFYILLVEHAIQMLWTIHQASPDTWVNPEVTFLPGEEMFVFTWRIQTSLSQHYMNVLDITLNNDSGSYLIRSTVNTYPTLVTLSSGNIHEPNDMAIIWLQWLLLNQ